MYSKLDRLEKNELKLPVNAGSCVKLANYLNKESDDNKQYFSQHEDHVSLSKVIENRQRHKGYFRQAAQINHAVEVCRNVSHKKPEKDR